jgi:hypothetical protein
MISLSNAVSAGLGVMPFIRRRAGDLGMLVWEDGPLPKLLDLHSGIYIREGGARAAYEQLSDEIAEALYPDAAGAAKPMPAIAATDTSAACGREPNLLCARPPAAGRRRRRCPPASALST